MGNSATGPGSPDDVDRWDGVETLGYRVLGVQPNSPASQAGLVSFLDFIVGAEGKPLFDTGEDLQEGEEYNDVDFPALLQEFKGRELELVVWNIKSQQQRWVTIVPSDTWGGAGLLGVTIRLDDYAQAEERLIHVLEVEHQSPAQIAGLVEYQDYLLGTTTETLDSTETLSKILQGHIDRVVEVYVYNCESDMVRVVALMPTWSWGGKGLLGAQVATGYLHRLPSSTQATCGSSLERKVRWVGLAGNNNNVAVASTTLSQLKQQQSTSSNGATTTTTTTTTHIPTLEMEPQLEMEADDDDEPPRRLEHKEELMTVKPQEVITPLSNNHQNGTKPSVSVGGGGDNCVEISVEAVEQQRYATPPSYSRTRSAGEEETEAFITTKRLVSADTAAAAASVSSSAVATKAISPSTAPPAVDTSTTTTATSTTPAEELFMGPPPVTPPNRRTAKRIQEPVKDPNIQVFVPPPMLSSPYWSQVATKKIQHQPLPTHRSRAFSSDSLDLR